MTALEKEYTEAYYGVLGTGASTASEVVVPLVKQLCGCKSVVDVGCGDGTWLRSFAQSGIEDYFGMDGDYVTPDQLKIPKERFQPTDLSKPFKLDRRFDLAMTLEVAEHLDPSRGPSYVEDLTKLSDVVLFSAAVPGQGGSHHVNEQWQPYWAEQFAKQGYLAFDCVRSRIWNSVGEGWYYAQNAILYVNSKTLDSNPNLNREMMGEPGMPLALIHPRLFYNKTEAPGITDVVKTLPGILRRTLQRRFQGVKDTPPTFDRATGKVI
jgi:SAM-dependent methyltransferase